MSACGWTHFQTCVENLKLKFHPEPKNKKRMKEIEETSVNKLIVEIETAMEKVEFVDGLLHMNRSIPIRLIPSVKKSPLVKVIEHPMSARPYVVLVTENGLIDLIPDELQLAAFLVAYEDLGPLAQKWTYKKCIDMEYKETRTCFENNKISQWLFSKLLSGPELKLGYDESCLLFVKSREDLREIAVADLVNKMKSGSRNAREEGFSKLIKGMSGRARYSDLELFLSLMQTHPDATARFALQDAKFFLNSLAEQCVPHYSTLIPLAFGEGHPDIYTGELVVKLGGQPAAELLFQAMRSRDSPGGYSTDHLRIYQEMARLEYIPRDQIESAIAQAVLNSGSSNVSDALSSISSLRNPSASLIEDVVMLYFEKGREYYYEQPHQSVFTLLRLHPNFKSDRLNGCMRKLGRQSELSNDQLFFLLCFVDLGTNFTFPTSLVPVLQNKLVSLSATSSSDQRRAAFAVLRACTPVSGNIFGDSAEVVTVLADKPDDPRWRRAMAVNVLDLLQWPLYTSASSLSLVERTFTRTDKHLAERLAIFAKKIASCPLSLSDIHIVVLVAAAASRGSRHFV